MIVHGRAHAKREFLMKKIKTQFFLFSKALEK
jgi:hypothetical protein